MIQRLFVRCLPALNKHPEIEVIGSAPDPVAARNDIVRLNRRDYLDLEMPRMDGIEFLRRIISISLPVIVVSSLTPEGRIGLAGNCFGAAMSCKPGAAYTIGTLAGHIAERIVAVAGRKMQVRKVAQPGKPLSLAKNLSTTTNMIIGIGA